MMEDNEHHYLNRSNWLRAAILGANDGILSTASIAIGVAAASKSSEPIVLAALAGLVAGALSMAAGEYVSVSSQSDIEKGDLEREKEALETYPEVELKELAVIYEERGLDPEMALMVAQKLSDHDALGAHARDELGIHEMNQAKPFQAALASGAAFVFGAMLPFLVTIVFPFKYQVELQYASSIVFLIVLGAVSARLGGSNMSKAIMRITFWGTAAMGLSALVGYLFGVNVA
jgi:VIT1/CCC1 family predicted Fe2+/Mn2+ transporter|tara:strand:- start:10592 stop:11287 length:696 start_codon:yes stop_codon:yes gene_type:complete